MEDSQAMFARVARVLFFGGLVAAVAVPACGGSSDDSSPSSGGSGGTAGSSGASSRAGSAGAGVANPPVACGKSSCNDDVINIPGASSFDIPACCSDEAAGQCGLDSSFLSTFGPSFAVKCQSLAQAGSLDASCPDSASTPVTGTSFVITFPGCCRANHTCGYDLDKIGGLFPLGLGCVDSTPFLDGGTPQACGDSGGAGQGGAGGEGPSGSAGAPAAGAGG